MIQPFFVFQRHTPVCTEVESPIMDSMNFDAAGGPYRHCRVSQEIRGKGPMHSIEPRSIGLKNAFRPRRRAYVRKHTWAWKYTERRSNAEFYNYTVVHARASHGLPPEAANPSKSRAKQTTGNAPTHPPFVASCHDLLTVFFRFHPIDVG